MSSILKREKKNLSGFFLSSVQLECSGIDTRVETVWPDKKKMITNSKHQSAHVKDFVVLSGASSIVSQSNTKKLSTQRLNPARAANPFETNVRMCKTLFSQSYVAGSIPCRLQSTASKHYLQWDAPASTGFSPDLLVVCADGLTEEQHPYCMMAPMMFSELVIRSEGCAELFGPIAEQLVNHLRKAMLQDSSFQRGLAALHLLLEHTRDVLAPHIKTLVPLLARKFRDRNLHDRIVDTLRLMEMQCGPEAAKLIKLKIPTF